MSEFEDKDREVILLRREADKRDFQLAKLREENERLRELLGRWITVHPIVLGTNIAKDTEQALSPPSEA